MAREAFAEKKRGSFYVSRANVEKFMLDKCTKNKNKNKTSFKRKNFVALVVCLIKFKTLFSSRKTPYVTSSFRLTMAHPVKKNKDMERIIGNTLLHIFFTYYIGGGLGEKYRV